jgi:hypothetical protein
VVEPGLTDGAHPRKPGQAVDLGEHGVGVVQARGVVGVDRHRREHPRLAGRELGAPRGGLQVGADLDHAAHADAGCAVELVGRAQLLGVSFESLRTRGTILRARGTRGPVVEMGVVVVHRHHEGFRGWRVRQVGH